MTGDFVHDRIVICGGNFDSVISSDCYYYAEGILYFPAIKITKFLNLRFWVKIGNFDFAMNIFLFLGESGWTQFESLTSQKQVQGSFMQIHMKSYNAVLIIFYRKCNFARCKLMDHRRSLFFTN